MNESQVKDFCKVLAEEKMTNFCITDVKKGEAIISIYGVHAEVGEMIAAAIYNNEEVEKLISTALMGALALRSNKPEKTVLDFLNVLNESK
jgi:hypothetical protein